MFAFRYYRGNPGCPTGSSRRPREWSKVARYPGHEDPFCLHDALNTFRSKGIALHIEKEGRAVNVWVKIADYRKASRIMPQLVTWSYWDITMPYFPQTVPPDWGPLTNRPAGLLEFVSHIEGLAKWQIVNLRREIQSLKQVEWNVRPFTGADGKVKTGVDVTVRGDRHIYILPGQKAPIPPRSRLSIQTSPRSKSPISFAARTGPIGPPCGHPQAQAEIG